jgi:hypothetical protein
MQMYGPTWPGTMIGLTLFCIQIYRNFSSFVCAVHIKPQALLISRDSPDLGPSPQGHTIRNSSEFAFTKGYKTTNKKIP